jgi:ketosteroid isomerase-like protein
MDTQQTMEHTQAFAEALHAVDRRDEGAIERMVDLFSPQATLTNAALKLAGEERSGHEGARTFWEQYQHSFQAASTAFFELTSSARGGGLFWTTSGTDAAGDPISYDGVTLLIFDDSGKIAQFRGYYDTRELSKRVSA